MPDDIHAELKNLAAEIREIDNATRFLSQKLCLIEGMLLALIRLQKAQAQAQAK